MSTSGSLKTVNGAFKHFWWLMFLITIIGVVGAGLTARQRQPTYQATATLNLDSTQSLGQGFDTALQSDQFLSQRFIQLASSRAVLQQACTTTKIKGCDPIALAKQVSATNSRATGLIDISVKSGSAKDAASLANAIADEVVRQNRAQADAYLDPTRNLLQNQLKQEDDRIQSIRGQISSVQRSGATEGSVANSTAPLLADLNTAQSQYTTTFNRLQDLDVVKSRLQSLLSVQQRALPPTAPIDPNLPVYLAVGLAAALLVGFLVALLAERLDDRIRDSGQLAEATGSQLVLEMPKPPSRRGDGEQSEREAASYALAHASMLVRQEGVRSVLVVAATLGDPVDDVGLGLARAAADFGDRVLVLQSSGNGNGGNGSDGPGGRGEVSHRNWALERTSKVVVEAVAKEDVGRELTTADGFDLIIACTPPPGYSSNAMSIVTSTDLAIVVATRGRTRFREARWASELLRHTGVPVAGAILRARGLVGRAGPRPRLAPLRAPEPMAPAPAAGPQPRRSGPVVDNSFTVEPRRQGRL
jgi:capsular polysaccharide biosynthesis protein